MSTDDFTHNDVLALIVHCVWTDLISAYVFFILFFYFHCMYFLYNFYINNNIIRYDSVYLTCSKKLTGIASLVYQTE